MVAVAVAWLDVAASPAINVIVLLFFSVGTLGERSSNRLICHW